MFEGNIPWTLEGPNDSITFDPHDDSTPFMLTAAPETAFDARGETYEYPLDDGALIGDQYAGRRVWSLPVRLRATDDEERSVQSQRLRALVNSLMRADGLLKWEPPGFPALQATVRRLDNPSPDGGGPRHRSFKIGLQSGDPRVYSQEVHVEAVSPASETLGSNLLSANDASFESSVAGWSGGGTTGSYSLERSNTYAHVGTYSMRLFSATQLVWGTHAAGVSVSPGDWCHVSCRMRTQPAYASTQGIVYTHFYNSDGLEIISSGPVIVTDLNSTFQLLEGVVQAPPGAVTCRMRICMSRPPAGGYAYMNAYVDDVKIRVASYSTTLTLSNAGDAETRPRFLIHGGANNPVITPSNARALELTTDIGASEYLTIDSAAREIYLGSTLNETTNRWDARPAGTPMPIASPSGETQFLFAATGTDANTLLTAHWQDAWLP